MKGKLQTPENTQTLAPLFHIGPYLYQFCAQPANYQQKHKLGVVISSFKSVKDKNLYIEMLHSPANLLKGEVVKIEEKETIRYNLKLGLMQRKHLGA